MTVRLSRDEGRAILLSKQARSNKYGALRTSVDGIAFDSKAEAQYYALLRLRERAGEVSAVELQKPFTLTAGAGFLVGTYRADFAFFDHKEKRERIIDVKGFDTPLSKWKRKHVRAQYGIEVEIVK